MTAKPVHGVWRSYTLWCSVCQCWGGDGRAEVESGTAARTFEEIVTAARVEGWTVQGTSETEYLAECPLHQT